jgi:hypothetical protein
VTNSCLYRRNLIKCKQSFDKDDEPHPAHLSHRDWVHERFVMPKISKIGNIFTKITDFLSAQNDYTNPRVRLIHKGVMAQKSDNTRTNRLSIPEQ